VKLRSVSESVRRGFGKTSDQGAVWDAVEAVAARHGVRSPTMDFDEIQEHVADDVDRLVEDVELRAGQSGVVVGIGGEVRMLELFDKPSTLACYWQSLLSGYATEALGQQEKPTPAAAAKRFGGKVARARSRDAAGAGIGTESHLEAPALTGVALSWNAAPVHLVAFAS
jgi:hypothetical protein